jgi:hypothetical protein
MKKNYLVIIFVGIFLFLPLHSAIANITNGTFDADLSGWIPEGQAQWWYSGVAQLAPGEGPENDNSRLSQDFILEENSKTLSFYVAMDIAETGETDIFTASLDGVTPFYYWDSSDVEAFDNTVVWLTEVTDNSRTVNLDVSDLCTGSHTLAFNLFNDYEDNVNMYIYIDNVNISGGFPAVPGPDSLILCCIGSLSFFLFRRRVL